MKRAKKRTKIQGSATSQKKEIIIAFAFILLSILLAYSSSLTGTWALDDLVVNRPIKIDDLSGLAGYRKIAYLTFLVNQKIGGFYPLTYRFFNIFIHFINSILLFFVTLMTVRRTGYKDHAYGVSLLTATVFALHPVNINAVSYIVQRMASLATMFVLLSLLSYRYAVLSRGLYRRVTLYLLTSLFILLGIFSKENAVMAIPLILLYDLFFISGYEEDGKRGFLKRSAVFLIAGGLVFLFAFVFLNLGPTISAIVDMVFSHFNDPFPARGWMATDVSWSPKEHILTGFRVVSRYLMIIALPIPSLFVFDWWGYPLSEGLLSPLSTLFAMAFVFSLLALSLILRRKAPFLSFGILWYLIAISLESFVALGTDIYFEHRNYLPAAGLFIGIVSETVLRGIMSPSRGRLWALTLIIAIPLGGFTFKRNHVFDDSITLWSDTIGKAPENLRAKVALGNAYLGRSDLQRAAEEYERAIKEGIKFRRAKFFADAAYGLGMIYLFRSEPDKAGELIKLIEKEVEGYDNLRILKAYHLVKTGSPAAGISILKEGMGGQDGFSRTVIYIIMGDAYREMMNLKEAEQSYKNALIIDPKSSSAYYGLAQVRLLQRDAGEAERLLMKAYTFDPENVLILSDISDILLIKGNAKDALRYAEKAVLRSPVFPNPYMSMGNILMYLGRDDDANKYYKEAIRRGASEPVVIYSKARALLLKGDVEGARKRLVELMERPDTPEDMKRVITGGMEN